jgi:hypothetical protein
MASPTPERPDSQGTGLSLTPKPECYTIATSRDDRIAIRTALQFGIPRSETKDTLKVSIDQIRYARTHPLTPQKYKPGRKPAIRNPPLETWLLQSPSQRRVAYKQIPILSSFDIGPSYFVEPPPVCD